MAKERVTLPAELRDELKPHIDLLVRRAQEAYRKGDDDYGGDAAVHTPATAEAPTHLVREGAASSSAHHGAELPRPKVIRAALEKAAAQAEAQKGLKKIIAFLIEKFPEVARALGY